MSSWKNKSHKIVLGNKISDVYVDFNHVIKVNWLSRSIKKYYPVYETKFLI